MRKVVLLMHMSLDGFVARPNGEMDWIHVEDDIFSEVSKITERADAALYGRVTYQMMESYWPTAAEQPDASEHDIEHGNWVNKASKFVFSRTLEKTNWQNTTIIHNDVPGNIEKLKQQPGLNLLLIGSPGLTHTFIRHQLIDEYYLNVNPVILGKGIPLFDGSSSQLTLKLLDSRTYQSGVIGLHYAAVKEEQ